METGTEYRLDYVLIFLMGLAILVMIAQFVYEVVKDAEDSENEGASIRRGGKLHMVPDGISEGDSIPQSS
jgi:hypothetical protein